jgi:hypothetical protein
VTTSTESELPQSIATAKVIFDTARNRRVPLDITLVVEAGARAIDAAERRSDLRRVAWQGVSAAISYGSALKVHFNVPLDLPDCSTTSPQWVLAKGITATDTTLLLMPIYSACRLNLDLTLHQRPAVYASGFDCKSCVVVYKGGQLAIVTPKLSFQDSTFAFSFMSEPPPDGRRLARTLLQSKFSEAE